MLSLFLFLFSTLVVVLSAPGAGQAQNSPRRHAPSSRSVVRRLSSPSITATSPTASNPNVTLTSAGIVPLVLASDKQTYYSLISIGNISFRAAVDTASSDIWVVSTACVTAQCKSLPRYPLTYHSPTLVSINDNATIFNVGFADTTYASGYVADETISLGGFTISQQAFGLMNFTNVTFVDQVSGIFGFGFPRLSSIRRLAANATPFFATLAQQGQLDYPLFGISLERNATPGSLSLGAVDSTIVKNISLIEWNEVVPFEPVGIASNVSSYLEWVIPISVITVGNQAFTLQPTYPQANSKSVALFDIGTSGIFGPYQDVERLFSVVDGSRLVDPTGQWAIPCNTNLTMTFTFRTGNYTLLPSDYIIGPTSGEPDLCLTWPKASPPSPDGIDWQIGSAFLRTVYTVFSYGIAEKEPPLIGLYPLQPAAVPLSPASLSALFSSLTLTVPTTLPNYLVPTPTLTTPPYLFNSSVPTSVIAMSDLATSMYAPLIVDVQNGVTQSLSLTTLPEVTPKPTAATLIITDANGAVHTTVSPLPTSTVVLGQPPGFHSAGATLRPYGVKDVLVVAFACIFTFFGIFS